MIDLLLAVTLVRGPILQNPQMDPTTATFVFYTDTPVIGEVEVNPEPSGGTCNCAQRVAGPVATRHEITVPGLTPGQVYHYTVFGGGTQLYGADFRAIPTDNTLRIAVIGDFGRDWPENDAAANVVAGLRPDIIVTVGDNVYNLAQFPWIDTRWLNKWKAANAQAFVLPTWGNHDCQTGTGATPCQNLRDVFSLPLNGGSLVPGYDERWYRFRVGQVELFGLDSDCGVSTCPSAVKAEQTDWYLSALQNSTAKWKLAFWHHVPFRCGDDAQGQAPSRAAWWGKSELHGVDAVFGGHAHSFSRRLIDDNGDGKKTWSIIVGRTGQPDGGPAYVLEDPALGLCTDNGWAAASLKNTFALLTFFGQSMARVEIIDVSTGVAIDTLEILK